MARETSSEQSLSQAARLIFRAKVATIEAAVKIAANGCGDPIGVEVLRAVKLLSNLHEMMRETPKSEKQKSPMHPKAKNSRSKPRHRSPEIETLNDVEEFSEHDSLESDRV